MPFFSSKFSPKKSKTRQSNFSTNEDLEALVLENRGVKLQLGDSCAYFQDGAWKIEGVKHAYKGNKKLSNKIQFLEEENNLLKLKLEVLLNMLVQANAEKYFHKPELDKSRKNEATV